MAEKAGDVAKDILQELVVQAAEQPLTADETQTVIRYMNRWMAMQDLNGIALGLDLSISFISRFFFVRSIARLLISVKSHFKSGYFFSKHTPTQPYPQPKSKICLALDKSHFFINNSEHLSIFPIEKTPLPDTKRNLTPSKT